MAPDPLPIRWTSPAPGGRAEPERCVLLHGFTQTGDCWPAIGLDGWEVGRVDLPGHGQAGAVRAEAWSTAARLAGSVDGAVTWVGYSMGARMALHLALAHPAAVARLVVVSGTAGLEDAEARAARRASDEALALRLESIGVEAFLEEWLALPLFAGIPPERRCLEQRRTNTVAGLASSLRLCGTGAQDSLWGRLGELAGLDVVIVTGELDAKFTAIGDRMAAAIGPSARRVAVAGCGHTPQLEDPGAFAAALGEALAPDR